MSSSSSSSSVKMIITRLSCSTLIIMVIILLPYINMAPIESNSNDKQQQQSSSTPTPSQLISPAKAIKLNRYRQLKLKVPINSTKKHRIKFGLDEFFSLNDDQQPQIELPTTNSQDRKPISLVFRSSSSPLSISHKQDHSLMANSIGSTSLLIENDSSKSSIGGYQLIEPLSPSIKKPTTTIPASIQEIVPLLIIPEIIPVPINSNQQPRLINHGNNAINQQQPNGETLKAIQHMIVAQDLSNFLYEPLLLASLTDQVIMEPSIINKNHYAGYENDPRQQQMWTRENQYLPTLSPSSSSISTSISYPKLTLENYQQMSQLKPQDLIIPTTWSTAFAMQNYQPQQQQPEQQQYHYNDPIQQSQSQPQQVEIAFFDTYHHHY